MAERGARGRREEGGREGREGKMGRNYLLRSAKEIFYGSWDVGVVAPPMMTFQYRTDHVIVSFEALQSILYCQLFFATKSRSKLIPLPPYFIHFVRATVAFFWGLLPLIKELTL